MPAASWVFIEISRHLTSVGCSGSLRRHGGRRFGAGSKPGLRRLRCTHGAGSSFGQPISTSTFVRLEPPVSAEGDSRRLGFGRAGPGLGQGGNGKNNWRLRPAVSTRGASAFCGDGGHAVGRVPEVLSTTCERRCFGIASRVSVASAAGARALVAFGRQGGPGFPVLGVGGLSGEAMQAGFGQGAGLLRAVMSGASAT